MLSFHLFKKQIIVRYKLAFLAYQGFFQICTVACTDNSNAL